LLTQIIILTEISTRSEIDISTELAVGLINGGSFPLGF